MLMYKYACFLLSPPLTLTISVHNDRRNLHVTDVMCDVWAERRSFIFVITGTLPTTKENLMKDGCLTFPSYNLVT
jgi:hypothetical protein